MRATTQARSAAPRWPAGPSPGSSPPAAANTAASGSANRRSGRAVSPARTAATASPVPPTPSSETVARGGGAGVPAAGSWPPGSWAAGELAAGELGAAEPGSASCPDLGGIIPLESGSATRATVERGRRYDARVDRAVPGGAPGPGAIVVSESRSQIGILFGFLSLAFAVALARGVTGAQSRRGGSPSRSSSAVLVLVCVRGWIMMIRRPARLEIAADVIRLPAAPRPGIGPVPPAGR